MNWLVTLIQMWARNQATQALHEGMSSALASSSETDGSVTSDSDADHPSADVGIVAALPIELSTFVDRLSHVKRVTAGGFRYVGGRLGALRIVIVFSGPGMYRATKAAQALVETYEPRWMISAGFAGGLNPDLSVGSVVVPRRLITDQAQSLLLGGAFDGNGSNAISGTLITTRDVVRTRKAKDAIYQNLGADVVDLETWAVANVCQIFQLPLTSVRVVSDDAHTELPPEIMTLVAPTGAVRWGATIGTLLKRPDRIGTLLSLRENADLCSKRLADFLEKVVLASRT